MNPEDILVVIAYPDESVAQAAHERLSVLAVENLVDLELAAYLTKDMRGRIKEHRFASKKGIRARFARHEDDEGIDRTLQESSQSLEPGAAALCVLVRSVTPEKVVPELSRYGGAVLTTSLPTDRDQLLKDAFARQLSAEEISAELTP